MTGIKSCPFCGSKAEIIEQPPTGPLNTLYRVQCSGLGHTPYNHEAMTNYFPTKQEAIEAWNQRYEPTCHASDMYENIFECSICGAIDIDGNPNYCPNCGAKVIEE